ncbi:MAG: phosphate ABC transporter substrate-binding protein [Calothrix sp. C42_A2020_038]|nr:phosphate ABC transporter substrate-binding protein [Calothrix sp. C42_A2020_038]
MNKSKIATKDTQQALETARFSYQEKLRELNQLEQQAQAAQISGDEVTARQLMTQVIEVEEQLSVLNDDIKYLENILNNQPKNKKISVQTLLIPFGLILLGFLAWNIIPKPTPQPIVSCLPSGAKLRINGSTSMAHINKKLKTLIESKCPGSIVETASNGTNIGIQQISTDQVDIAAVSRPLRAQEQAQGLVANFLTHDAIAVIVGKNNEFKQGLTIAQLREIFKGNLNNWSAVGGKGEIQVINRAPASGTHSAFKELVLNNEEFGTTSNITTHPLDETTPIIQKLQNNGISYATYAQVKNQTKVRIVPIDGLNPDSKIYPLRRQLFYIYKEPMSPVVKSFMDFLASSEVKKIIEAN